MAACKKWYTVISKQMKAISKQKNRMSACLCESSPLCGGPQLKFSKEIAGGEYRGKFQHQCLLSKHILFDSVFHADFEYDIYSVHKNNYNGQNRHIRARFSMIFYDFAINIEKCRFSQ